MKTKITLLIALLIGFISIAQNGINYKAVIKDDLGIIIANQTITIEFAILQDMVPVYEETHTPTTNDKGIIIVRIGEGAQTGNGLFSEIDWAAEAHFLNVKIDTGNGLQDMGTTAFNYVPYAKVADRSQTNASVVFPKYLDRNYTDFTLTAGG